jgi:Family of unknown function (DUF6499)
MKQFIDIPPIWGIVFRSYVTNSKSNKLRGACTRRLTCRNKSNAVGDPERIVTVIVFMPRTEPEASWQSPSAYSHLLKMDMAGLAWEWLRRIPTYTAEYTSKAAQPESIFDFSRGHLPALDTPATASAGLHFP